MKNKNQSLLFGTKGRVNNRKKWPCLYTSWCDIKMWVNFSYISCKCEWFCNFLESLVTTIYWFSFHVLRQDCLPSQCTSALPHLWTCLWHKAIVMLIFFWCMNFLPFFELQPSHLAFPLKSSMPGFSLSMRNKKEENILSCYQSFIEKSAMFHVR